MRDKIDRTIKRSLDMVEKLEKLFGNNGAFEQAVAENGGDIGWFGDVRENLKTLYSNIEELHMGAVSHMDESESVAESKMADMMIAASEMSKEEFAKAYPAFAKDYAKLRKQQMADEANESLNYIKKLAGIEESEYNDEFVGFNTKTGDIQQLLSYDEVCSGRFTHMMNQEEFTYFNPDEEDDMIGSSDEEMEEMGWEKCPAIKNMKYEEKDS